MSADILVLSEHIQGKPLDVTFEMLGLARKLSGELGGRVYALALGAQAAQVASQLGAANVVILAAEDAPEQPAPEVALAALQTCIESKGILLVLLGGTNAVLGIGARLAARTRLPFVNFCKGIRLDNGTLLATSALLGGKIMSDVRLPDNKGILSIASGSAPADAGRSTKAPVIEKLALPSVPAKVVFRRLIEPAGGDVDITKMDILVSVGRGIQNADNIPLADELAKVMGGAVSASRPVVDQGWLPLTRQVGKSGMSVSPKLYLALGISGAPEHWEGMKGAQMVVAINTDPKAPIFNFAHYGATVDCLEFIESMKAAVEKRKSSSS